MSIVFIILFFIFILALVVYFWNAAKQDERAGIICVSIVLGGVYSVYTTDGAAVVNLMGILDLLLKFFLSSLGASIAIVIIIVAVNLPIKKGEAEFYTYKAEYVLLQEGDSQGILTPEQKKRLEYLKSKKCDFSGEFKPKRFGD